MKLPPSEPIAVLPVKTPSKNPPRALWANRRHRVAGIRGFRVALKETADEGTLAPSVIRSGGHDIR